MASGATLTVGNHAQGEGLKGGTTASTTTSAVYGITGDVTPPAIAAGQNHSLAIRMMAWRGLGANTSGQVGDGPPPHEVAAADRVGITSAVAARVATRIHLLVSDGTLVGFGSIPVAASERHDHGTPVAGPLT
jgi:hypothetical protein